MKNDIKFSIHVPVYKTEKYLDICIESIVNQTYRNFECILVDDGSPEPCPSMCDQWAMRDRRIKVIHQKNAGLLGARRASLKMAEGDYILFVDSDDWVREDWLETIKNAIESFDADIVAYNWFEASEKGKTVNNHSFTPNHVYIDSDKEELYIEYLRGMPYSLWSKAYKLSVIDKDDDYHMYGRCQIGEDAIQLAYPWRMAEKIVYIDEPLYYYRKNENSLTHTASISKVSDHMKMLSAKYKFVLEVGKESRFFEAFSIGAMYVYFSIIYEMRYAHLSYQESRGQIDRIKQSREYKCSSNCINFHKLSIKDKIRFRLFLNSRYRLLFMITDALIWIKRIEWKRN